jgi:hypothetical protein
MTSLQKNANVCQRWPLLNLIRQILNTFGFKMDPIRKSDGYTLDGIKKYKRFFQIVKKKKKNIPNETDNDNDNDNDNEVNNDNNIKKIDLKLNDDVFNNSISKNDV